MPLERVAIPTPVASTRPILVVATGAFAIGVLTSIGQGLLPSEINSLANSAGSWSIAAFLLCLCNTAPRRGLLLGPLALAAMLVGYNVTTELRGFATGTTLWLFWGFAAIAVGPVLGVGAAWVRGADRRKTAAGSAAVAGILVGEGLYGLTRIADTTSAGYWAGQIGVGLGIVLAVSALRLRRLGPITLCALLTAAMAAAIYLAYTSI